MGSSSCLAPLPKRASASASSLPLMSQWPGTHTKSKILDGRAHFSRAPQMSAQIRCRCADGPAAKALSAERESVQRRTLVTSSAPTSILESSVSAECNATHSARKLLVCFPAGRFQDLRESPQWITTPAPPRVVPPSAEPSVQTTMSAGGSCCRKFVAAACRVSGWSIRDVWIACSTWNSTRAV